MKHALLPALGALAWLAQGCEVVSERDRHPPPPVAREQPPPAVSTNAPGADHGSGWKSLFDGKTLRGWTSTDFAGRGDVTVENGTIVLDSGLMTGVTWTNAAELPRLNYEIALDAMRVDGSDFFCGLTFPVGEDPCSFIVGGWGGGVVGLSSLDGQDAANNETTQYMNFENDRWFAVRVRVTGTNIQAWIDGDKVVDASTKDRRLSIRPEVEASKPLGVATYSTKAALRNIRVRKL